MGLLQKIFGTVAPRHHEEILLEGQALLTEAEELVNRDAPAASKMLRSRAGDDLETLFDFGAPLHTRFVELALRIRDGLRARQNLTPAGLAPEKLPSVHTVSDVDEPSAGLVLDAVRQCEADLIYARAIGQWGYWIDTLLAIDALCEMLEDPNIVAAFIGEEYLIARRDVLIDALQNIAPTTPFPEMVRTIGDYLDECEEVKLDDKVTPNGYEIVVYLEGR